MLHYFSLELQLTVKTELVMEQDRWASHQQGSHETMVQRYSDLLYLQFYGIFFKQPETVENAVHHLIEGIIRLD